MTKRTISHPSRRDLGMPFRALRASLAPSLAAVRAAAPRPPTGTPDHVLSIFLRGGADGLTLLAPSNDPHYQALRDVTEVWDPANPSAPPGQVGLPLTAATPSQPAFFVPQALAPLKELFDDPVPHLALFHAAGSFFDTQSHFDQQKFVEDGGTLQSAGWLGRHLQTKTDHFGGTPPSFRAIGLSSTLAQTLQGGPGATPVASLESYEFPVSFPASSSEAAAREATVDLMYDAFGVPLGPAMDSVLDAIAKLGGIDYASYVPAGGASYPTSKFGSDLKKIAQLTKAVAQVEAVHVDLGGWDTHFNQGVHTPGGRMHDLMDDLARSLRAYYRDLQATVPYRKFIVVVVTEFGRKVKENSSGGTDHGRGGVAIVLGSDVVGGVYTSWPGLDPATQQVNGDLAVTTELRDVFGTIVERSLANSNVATVIPNDPATGYVYGGPLGFLP